MPLQIFKDQVAVVTGAGEGIGFEIARRLALQGAAVLLNDIKSALAKRAAENILVYIEITHRRLLQYRQH